MSSNAHIVRTVSQVFHAVAVIDVGPGNTFTLHRPAPRQICDLLRSLLTKLATGWRFIHTPGYGYCGVHALILGLTSWMQQQGQAFNINTAWTRLEQYFKSRKYKDDAFDLMYKLSHLAIDFRELEPIIRHTNMQLQALALELSKVFLQPGEVINVVFVKQAANGQPLHYVQEYDFVQPHQTSVRLFIHAANDHHQAFALQPHTLSLRDQQRVLGYQTHHHSDAGKKHLRSHIKFVPDGDKLLWLEARIDTDAEGRNNPCLTPKSSREIELILGIKATAAVRHRAMAAKRDYIKKHGWQGLRTDHETKIEQRARTAAVAAEAHDTGANVAEKQKLSPVTFHSQFEKNLSNLDSTQVLDDLDDQNFALTLSNYIGGPSGDCAPSWVPQMQLALQPSSNFSLSNSLMLVANSGGVHTSLTEDQRANDLIQQTLLPSLADTMLHDDVETINGAEPNQEDQDCNWDFTDYAAGNDTPQYQYD